jgi:hypothetical protein
MMSRHIHLPQRLYNMESIEETIPYLGAQEWHGPRWLKRIFKKFGWLKTPVYNKRVTYWNDCYSENLLESIQQAMNDVYRYGYTPRRFVIGEEEWKELINQKDMKLYGALSYVIGANSSYKMELEGLEVRVLPWIKGWAVI